MSLKDTIKKNKRELIAATLTALVMFKLLRKKEAGAAAVNDASSELTKAKKENPPSYSKSQYKLAADTLENAMYDAGTDEAAIYRIMGSLKNNTDFLELIIAFGTRQKYEFAIPTFKGNLARWFNDELNSSEIQKVNELLKNNSIKYRF